MTKTVVFFRKHAVLNVLPCYLVLFHYILYVPNSYHGKGRKSRIDVI